MSKPFLFSSLVAISFIAATIVFLHYSNLKHLSALEDLCNREVKEFSGNITESVGSLNRSCGLIANDEFVLFESKGNPKIEFVCYDRQNRPYTIEEQNCRFYIR